MSLVHVGLDLEDEGRKIGAEGIDLADVGGSGQRGRSQLQEVLQEGLDAEVGQCRAEEHRAQLTAADGLHVHFTTGRQKFHIVDQLLMLGFGIQQLRNLGIIQINGHLVGFPTACVAGEEDQFFLLPVVNTLDRKSVV